MSDGESGEEKQTKYKEHKEAKVRNRRKVSSEDSEDSVFRNLDLVKKLVSLKMNSGLEQGLPRRPS